MGVRQRKEIPIPDKVDHRPHQLAIIGNLSGHIFENLGAHRRPVPHSHRKLNAMPSTIVRSSRTRRRPDPPCRHGNVGRGPSPEACGTSTQDLHCRYRQCAFDMLRPCGDHRLAPRATWLQEAFEDRGRYPDRRHRGRSGLEREAAEAFFAYLHQPYPDAWCGSAADKEFRIAKAPNQHSIEAGDFDLRSLDKLLHSYATQRAGPFLAAKLRSKVRTLFIRFLR